MDVYVTKWALTDGILLCSKIEDDGEIDNRYCRARLHGAMNNYLFLAKPDWHLTLEEAEARFETMRLAKLKSIQKQAAKLEKMKPALIDKRQ